MSVLLVVAAFIICLVFSWLLLRQKNSGLPPGPRGLPIIGNVLQIVKDPHIKLSEWTKDFGDIFTIYLATKPTVVISDVKLMRELFAHPSSTGKFKTDTLILATRGPFGIVNSEGKLWEEQRNAAERILAKHSFSGRIDPGCLDLMYMPLLHDLIEVITTKMEDCSVVPLSELLASLTANALRVIATNENVSVRDSALAKINEEFVDGMQKTQQTGLAFVPWLKYIAPVASGFKEYDEVTKRFHDMIEGMYKQQKSTHTSGAPRHLIDSYVDRVNSESDPSSSFFGELGEKNAIASTLEVFIAGSEATGQMMKWLVLYLSRNTEAQRKLQSEIDVIVGKNRDPDLSYKQRMPYTEAVILEALRYSSLVPLGFPHQLLDDIQFHGYTLPKGTLLIGNGYHAHHNREIWTNPELYQPERFLDETYTTIINRDKIVPFQAGRRVCLGESVARNMLFLFTAKFFQTFEVYPDPEDTSNLKPVVGLLLSPPPLCKVTLKLRN